MSIQARLFEIGLVALLCALFAVGAAAQPLSCTAAKTAKSGQGDKKVMFKVINETGGPVILTWIDFGGKPVEYAEIKPGQALAQSTFDTHAWIVSSGKGDCICGLVADADQTWTVGGRGCRAGEPLFEPTSSYHTETSPTGWRVLVSNHLFDSDADALRRKTMARLWLALDDMAARLPKPAVAALRSTPIWLELDDPMNPGGVYHPSLDWLKANGFNPDKVSAVQFAAKTFTSWIETQPAMVLHEYSHAFLNQFLGDGHPELVAAFERACKAGLYADVQKKDGWHGRAYALDNQMEFFAELSEAFFWQNDFSPYEHDDLVRHDPASAAMIASLWDGGHKPLKRIAGGATPPILTCP